MFRAHIKHIKAHYHYICEKSKNEEVEPVHVPSQKQLVNVMTKPLGRLKFEKFEMILEFVVFLKPNIRRR
jgi:hypothetical protein